jgi:hypothetical protein
VFVMSLVLLLMFSSYIPGITMGLFWVTHTIIIILFIFLIIKIWTKKSFDEREQSHKSIASEISFGVTGSLILFFILKETFYMNQIDYELYLVLIVMILTRFITRVWLEKNC